MISPFSHHVHSLHNWASSMSDARLALVGTGQQHSVHPNSVWAVNDTDVWQLEWAVVCPAAAMYNPNSQDSAGIAHMMCTYIYCQTQKEDLQSACRSFLLELVLLVYTQWDARVSQWLTEVLWWTSGSWLVCRMTRIGDANPGWVRQLLLNRLHASNNCAL